MNPLLMRLGADPISTEIKGTSVQPFISVLIRTV